MKSEELPSFATIIHPQTPASQSYGAVEQHRVGYPLGGDWAPSPSATPMAASCS